MTLENIAREKLIQELALECRCTPLEERPCAGLLAGGLCDDLHPDGRESELDIWNLN